MVCCVGCLDRGCVPRWVDVFWTDLTGWCVYVLVLAFCIADKHLVFFLVSAMKKKFEKEAMENET